jgi:transposase
VFPRFVARLRDGYIRLRRTGFSRGRNFAAWLGLTPKDHSTAGKQRLGLITRAGDEALRWTLVVGATAVIQQVRKRRCHPASWLVSLLKRKPPKVAAVALANKTARIAWKLMVSGEITRPDTQAASLLRRPGRKLSAVLAPSRPLRAASRRCPAGSLDCACARRLSAPVGLRRRRDKY